MIGESKTQLFEVFKTFDKDSSGFVDKGELIAIAKQLNQELTQDEVDKVLVLISQLMAVVDINKDNQISFDEFWNWWQYGKNGKLEKLVFMKLKLMNLLKKVNSEFTRFGISLYQKYDKSVDHHYWAVNYGDHPCHVKLDSNLLYKGSGIKAELQKESENFKGLQLVPKKFFECVILIRSLKPEQAKQEFQTVYDGFLKAMQDENEGDEEIYEFLSQTNVNLSTITDYLIISVTIKHPLVQEFIEAQYNPFLSQLGEEIECEFEFNVGIKNGLKKMMKKNQIFIKYLLEGFLVEFRAKFNTNLAKKMFNIALFMIQAAQQAKQKKGKGSISKFKQAFTFPLLFKSSKFHLQFKNMEDIDSFLRSMGLEDLVEEQPNARDLIQEIISEGEVEEIKDPKQLGNIIYQAYQFGCKNLIAQGYVYLMLPNAMGKIKFSFDGIQEVMECLFREDAESKKQKK